jgi:hypothetical protein
MRKFIEHARASGLKYDAVMIARPDIAFYTRINTNKMDLALLNVPLTGGNWSMTGRAEHYFAMSYRNAKRAEFIPFHSIVFSDQAIISSFDNMAPLADLYETLGEYDARGVPTCHPETTLYYHLGYSRGIKSRPSGIIHEIIRSDSMAFDNEALADTRTNSDGYNRRKKMRKKIKGDIAAFGRGLAAPFKLADHAIKLVLAMLGGKK